MCISTTYLNSQIGKISVVFEMCELSKIITLEIFQKGSKFMRFVVVRIQNARSFVRMNKMWKMAIVWSTNRWNFDLKQVSTTLDSVPEHPSNSHRILYLSWWVIYYPSLGKLGHTRPSGGGWSRGGLSDSARTYTDVTQEYLVFSLSKRKVEWGSYYKPFLEPGAEIMEHINEGIENIEINEGVGNI